MLQLPGKKYTDNQIIRCFLLLWTLFNLIQSYFLELHSDEAYYWVYSKFLDWGYFDHPPMVAVFIRLGDALLHNELGLRLFTIIASGLSFYFLWLIVKRYEVNARWFIALVSSVLIFHVYGFTSTPDSALFFFAVLFFYFYQKYLESDRYSLALAIGLVLLGLLYSKYHGVLLILFTLLSNFNIFKRRSFWLIPLIVVAGYMPHIIWQIQHDFPSVQYHLFDRSESHYQVQFTIGYFLGQLLVAGPLVGWLWFYKAFKAREQDKFTRALRFNLWGILIFFLFSTLKGEVQPQWTLIAFIPFLILALVELRRLNQVPLWLRRLLLVNLALIVLTRIGLMANVPFMKKIGALRSYYGNQQWANSIKEKAGDAYVLFYNGFQEPSKYDYYTNSLKGFTYDARTYRKTQFDIWPIEDEFQGKRVYVALESFVQGLTIDSIPTPKKMFYGGWIDDVRTYQRVKIEVASYKMDVNAGDTIPIELTIINPYNYPIDFGDEGYTHKATLEACFMQDEKDVHIQPAEKDFKQIRLEPGEQTNYLMPVIIPDKPGKYELVFSIKTEPFEGPRNNRFIKINVK
jgi:hypothetical protein